MVLLAVAAVIYTNAYSTTTINTIASHAWDRIPRLLPDLFRSERFGKAQWGDACHAELMRLKLNAVNAELQRQGYTARLAKAQGYFYFWSGEAADWLDRTVRVPRIGDLLLEQWVGKFLELRQRNDLLGCAPV